MSDRTYSIASSQICPNCVETPSGYVLCKAHLVALQRNQDRPAVSTPVDPPVLSRAEMGKICDDLCAKSKTGLFGWPFVEELMDAILESLSQEDASE